MKVIEHDRNYSSKLVKDFIEKSMSWFHSYYATSCIESGVCRALIAYDSGVVGVGVFYVVHEIYVGVIYYIAVSPRHRGRGVGKIVLASIEEILDSENTKIFIATTKRENIASRKMLIDLGYEEIGMEKISKDLEEVITMMTCSYEDDLLYVKQNGIDVQKFLTILTKANATRAIEDIWRKICYAPWVRLRRARY